MVQTEQKKDSWDILLGRLGYPYGDSYEKAESTVIKMINYLSKNFEDIPKSGVNFEIEEMRNKTRCANYSSAIDLAEQFYHAKGFSGTLVDKIIEL